MISLVPNRLRASMGYLPDLRLSAWCLVAGGDVGAILRRRGSRLVWDDNPGLSGRGDEDHACWLDETRHDWRDRTGCHVDGADKADHAGIVRRLRDDRASCSLPLQRIDGIPSTVRDKEPACARRRPDGVVELRPDAGLGHLLLRGAQRSE